MIKGVLFDYGGVVSDGGRGIDIAKRLCAALKLPESAVDEILLPLFRAFTRGRLDETGFWSEIETKANIPITEDQRHLWNDWWGRHPYPEMLTVINRLKAAGYPVGLLSNIIPPAKEKIAAAGGYDSFDFVILSCDVGHAKPDPEMYDMAMAQFNGLQSEEVVFVDDQEKCLPPAQALGIETILATSTEQIIADLRKLDLPV